MKKFTALFCAATLVFSSVPVIAADSTSSAAESVTSEAASTASAPSTSSASSASSAAEESEGTAVPTVEGSIFVAPLRPENAQALMDAFEKITGEEGNTSYDLALMLAGEENELTDEELAALEKAFDGYETPLSDGYLTDKGAVIFDAVALGLEDGDKIVCLVMQEGKPAFVESEARDGKCEFEVEEPSVCFVFAETGEKK